MQPKKSHAVVIKFAGDSGDGMQLTGNEFTQTAALFGNDVSTFPDFPAEIRAPKGTIPGVSGFQLQFSDHDIHSAGDRCDVLIAMNAAALKANLHQVKEGGTIIADISGFDSKNLRLSRYSENPLETGVLSGFVLHAYDFTKLTTSCLAGSGLDAKTIDRSKNIFVLGFIYWLFGRDNRHTEQFLTRRFKNSPVLRDANIRVLRAGWHFGETVEKEISPIEVAPAKLAPGKYRSIIGNQGTALGLLAAAHRSKLPLFYGSYPITPASDILHELAKHQTLGVSVFQAEDEIAAAGAALGASYGGVLGVTGTSGPGMALKSETISLAVSLELPLVIIDVQHAGPSTGMPTKTEQADLLMALHGRHGEAPLPVIAAQSPADAFMTAFEACQIALEHMTPVIMLSDAYVANGSAPWRFPRLEHLPGINPPFHEGDSLYQPYKRDERGVRQWLPPGNSQQYYRIGGLEKEDITGNISYDPANHQKMVNERARKVRKIAERLPIAKITTGMENGDLLMISWGSTYGCVRSAVEQSIAQGRKVSQLHLRWLNPLPAELENRIKAFQRVCVAELNSGQLAQHLKATFSLPMDSLQKVEGQPFRIEEIQSKIDEYFR